MVSAKQFRSERHIERGSTNALPISRESEIEIEVRGSYLVILLGALVAGSVSFMGYVVSLAEFRPRETPLASVLLQISNNTTRDEDGALADLTTTPVSMRMKLLAAYLANDIEPESRLPVYGDVVGPRNPSGNLSLEMHERRIYTNQECDPDGDSVIDDCDITTEWKYPNQVQGWLELADQTESIADILNPFRQYITPGLYRFVVVQTCLENALNGTYFSFRGATMAEDFYFRLPRCFHLAAPLPEEVEVKDGDEITFTLAYKLDGLLQAFTLDEIASLTEEWTCFVEDGSDDAVCIMMPAFIPTYRRWINFPVQLGNTTAEEAAPSTATAGDSSAEAEAFEKECTVKFTLAGSLRLCLWPSRFWGWVVMVALIFILSILGVVCITLKMTLEHLWQTGTSPSMPWPLRGNKRAGVKGAGGSSHRKREHTPSPLVRRRMGPDSGARGHHHSDDSQHSTSPYTRSRGMNNY